MSWSTVDSNREHHSLYNSLIFRQRERRQQGDGEMHEPLTSATIILFSVVWEVNGGNRENFEDDNAPVDIVEDREEVEDELDQVPHLVCFERTEDLNRVVLPIVCHKPVGSCAKSTGT